MHQVGLDADVKTPLLDRRKATNKDGKPDSTPQNEDRPSGGEDAFHIPNWTRYRTDQSGRRFPQSIAHRGFKAKYPENTMASMKGAVEAGAHALETDIHLSKDDVVVLSHDPDLKRCFGKKEKIIDCEWDHLSTLRTLREPHEPMPRLKDLLEYVAQPGLQHIWILLDIKLDNDSEKVMRLIADTISSVRAGERPWNDRIVLGIWAVKYLPLCQKYSPGFPVSYIGFSVCYARQFLRVPGVSFNMLQKALMNPFGRRFIHDVKKAQRPLFVWTVNEVNLMKWSIQREVDGVVTDDPKLFNQVCDEWDDDEAPAWPNFWQIIYTLWLYALISVFIIPFRRRFPEKVEQFIKAKDLRAKGTLKLGA